MKPNCDECGKDIYGDADDVRFYELTYHHSERSGRLDIGGGRSMPVPGDDLMVERTKTFCSARCLVRYVADHIAPDAVTEDGDS